jgi:hypothetical protein
MASAPRAINRPTGEMGMSSRHGRSLAAESPSDRYPLQGRRRTLTSYPEAHPQRWLLRPFTTPGPNPVASTASVFGAAAYLANLA